MIRRAWRKRAFLHAFVGLLLLVPCGTSAGGERLAYEDVVGEALGYSSRLKAKKEEVFISEANYRQSLSNLYPTLALNGRLERFNNLTRQDSIGTINGAVVGGLQDEWRSSVFVLGEYTLSNWYKKRYESDYYERLTEASLYESESEKKKIVLEITDRLRIDLRGQHPAGLPGPDDRKDEGVGRVEGGGAPGGRDLL